MTLRLDRIVVCVAAAGTLLAACGVDRQETAAEKRYVKICTQYIDAKYDDPEALCRCQWKGISAEVAKDDMDEFFFKLTAGRRFETKASRMIDRIASKCVEQMGPRPAD